MPPSPAACASSRSRSPSPLRELGRCGAAGQGGGLRRRLVAAQARFAELARGLEDRVGHGGEMAVDALEVADDVEVDRAGLERFGPALTQAVEMTLRGAQLGIADRGLFRQQPA